MLTAAFTKFYTIRLFYSSSFASQWRCQVSKVFIAHCAFDDKGTSTQRGCNFSYKFSQHEQWVLSQEFSLNFIWQREYHTIRNGKFLSSFRQKLQFSDVILHDFIHAKLFISAALRNHYKAKFQPPVKKFCYSYFLDSS